MNESEREIIIRSGTMINLSGHEDDSYEILTQDVEAIILGPAVNNALPIRIPVLDEDRTYYLHQPEKPASR
jgi:hypothetical protein